MPVKADPPNFSQVVPRTTLSACLDEPIPLGRNVVWCATFQLAWDVLGKVLGGDPRLSGTPTMEQSLNRHVVGPGDLDEESCLTDAGFGREGIVDRIKRDLKAKFGDKADPKVLPDRVADDDILAYAYLMKNLEFEVPFEKGKPRPFAGEPGVETFGFGISKGDEPDVEKTRARVEQIRILHYRSGDEFTVELATKSANDRLILARTKPGKTLEKTTDAVLASLGEPSTPAWDERLIVPKREFDLTIDFPAIEGRPMLNPGFEAYRVGKALQNVRFRLNEEGAVLVSDASMALAGGVPQEPRVFNLCAPHLTLLMRRGAKRPYFAMWTANAELLCRA